MNINKKVFLVITILFFSIFTFTSDAHRSTSDEEFLQQQALRIVLQTPDPDFVLGESGSFFNYPQFWYPHMQEGGGKLKCKIGIICYPIGIAFSTTAVPFIFLNQQFNFLTNDSVNYTTEDFIEPHYVWWRNSLDPDMTFMELFYGPFYLSLAIGVFFLISRAFNYKITTSISLAFLLGLSTIFFVYSQTSYSTVPSIFFLLTGFLYFKKFLDNSKILHSTIAASFLVFAFMIRGDVIFFIIPMFVFFIIYIIKQRQRILKLISFTLPLILGWQFDKFLESLRYDVNSLADPSILIDGYARGGGENLQGIFGILFSPGVGLFIYVPILLTVFFTYRDFFTRERKLTVLLLVISAVIVIHFSSFTHWEGFTAHPPKYLFSIIPFLLLPLGASIEKRGKKILAIVIGLGILGFFFNFVTIIQDVSYFVWGQPGGFTGLMSLAQERSCPIYICPEVTWTFQFSPLITTISLALSKLQPDLFLLKLLGIQYYLPLLFSILSIQFYLLYRIVRSHVTSITQKQKNS